MEVKNPGTAANKMVEITRIIDAPRDLVFKAWTDPEFLKRWYAPQGCSVHFSQIDIKPGGHFHCCIKNPKYHDCWSIGTYREIIVPERIVYTIAISDANGTPITALEAGMDPEWPAETIVTVEFTEHDGKTMIKLRQTVSESIAKRTGAHPSWIEMFDRLAEDVKWHGKSASYQ